MLFRSEVGGSSPLEPTNFCLFYVFLLAAYNDTLGSQRKRKLEQKYENDLKEQEIAWLNPPQRNEVNENLLLAPWKLNKVYEISKENGKLTF